MVDELGQPVDDEGEGLADRDIASELSAERRDLGIDDAARHDAIERGEVVIAIQGEAVHGHSLGHANADRGDLAVRSARVGRYPHPAAPGHLRRCDSEFGADLNKHRLDAPHVGDEVRIDIAIEAIKE